MELAVNRASCGCGGLQCYACGRAFRQGDLIFRLGLTKLCKVCAGDAIAEWVRNLVIVEPAKHA